MQIFVKLLDGRILTLEVEGHQSTEELKAMLAREPNSLPAAQQRIFLEDETQLEVGMSLADYHIKKEATLRLVPRPKPALCPAQLRSRGAMEKLLGAQLGMDQRWYELAQSKEQLESRKRAMLQRYGGGNLKDRLKLTVGGEQITTKRSILCAPFPGSKLDAVFSGRYHSALLKDPADSKRFYIDGNPACFHKLIDFCEINLNREEGQPLQMPEVAPELETMMHATFRYFGVEELFVTQADETEEPVPELEAEPEPERPEEAVPPVDAGGAPDAAEPVTVVVPDGRSVSLPPRTVDHIVSARYGTLDDGQWADVTEVVAQQLDIHGGLELCVSQQALGCDPSEDGAKSLSISYAPCQAWERTAFADLFAAAEAATASEHRALRSSIAAERGLAQKFANEQSHVERFFAKQPSPRLPEVVQLNVRGEKLFCKRTTLMLCPESRLAELAREPAAAAAAGAGEDTESDSDEEEQQGGAPGSAVLFVDQSKYCFKKLIDQLRLIAMAAAEPGQPPPPPPTVKPDELSRFNELVAHYFPDREAFIRTEGVHRPLGTGLAQGRPTRGNGSLSSGADGALVVPRGETVVLESRRVYNYTELRVEGTLTVTAQSEDARGGFLLLRAAQTVITATGCIDVAGRGYAGGAALPRELKGTAYQGASPAGGGARAQQPNGGGGGGGLGSTQFGSTGGGGGGHGATGQPAAPNTYSGGNRPGGQGGQAYGDAQLSVLHLGSGGGSGHPCCNADGVRAGNGGGCVVLMTDELSSEGAISACGEDAPSTNGGQYVSGGGGGAGGSIWLVAGNVRSVGAVRAAGGAGQAQVNLYGSPGIASAGGNGGAGRIRTDGFGDAAGVGGAVAGTDVAEALRDLADGSLVERCHGP